MKAGKCLCCALAVGVLMFGMTAFGQEIRWQPVGAQDDQSANPGVSSEIFIEAGDPVMMEIEVSGWGSASGSPTMAAYQGTLDSNGSDQGTGYDNGVGTPIVPPLGCPPPLGAEDDCYIDQGHPTYVMAGAAPIAAVVVATCDYGWGGVAMGDPVVDGGGQYYAGTLLLSTAGAAGTYELGFDASDLKTFFNSGAGPKIPGLVRTTGKITIPLGQCCYTLGPGTSQCAEVSNAACGFLPGPRQWLEGVACPPGGPDCPSCTDSSQCDDTTKAPFGGVCTDDECISYVCYNTPNYDPAFCCNPVDHELILIDDGDDCTLDECDRLTGAVTHTPQTGTACVHPNDCVINDVCDAGVCVGDSPDSLMISCVDDSDCAAGAAAGWYCETDAADPMFEYCNCKTSAPLCVLFDDDDLCVEQDGAVSAILFKGASSAVVTGFQALMTYEPECLEFVAIGPCQDSIHTTVVDWYVDEVEGEIWYAAIGYDELTYAVVGTAGDANLACIDFKYIGECDCCDVCIISRNPYNTLLTDERGKNVDLDICDCEDEVICGDGELTLTVPPGGEINAGCGVKYGELLWDAPVADDTCQDAELECFMDHDGGVDLPVGMIDTGGVFPQGKTYFVCTATDETCTDGDDTITKVWTVDVSDQQALDIEVHLGPTMYDGMYERCICFYLYDTCEMPEPFCTEMMFGGPWNFPDHAVKTIKVDKGNYTCIEARDPLHTLRSTADVECIGDAWTAVFKGDPDLQWVGKPHWLVGGNLDFYEAGGSADVIDVLDFGVYMYQVSMGAAYAGGGSNCGPSGDPAALYPHADINADGLVDALDYLFLTENFLADSKHGCCEDPGASATPTLDVSVKWLRQNDMGHLAVGDLNRDGRLNTEDMAAYSAGEMPTTTKTKRTR